MSAKLSLVTQAYCPSYSRGSGGGIESSKPAQATEWIQCLPVRLSETLSQKERSGVLRMWLGGGAPA